MGIVNSNKTISVSEIECGGTFDVTLSLTGMPNISSNPTDIVLLLDQSGSMGGAPIAALKESAKKFVDIIDKSTDEKGDGQIGGGSEIGIVGFESTATISSPLTTSVAQLNTAIDRLMTEGGTNHEDAFAKALQMLQASPNDLKVMVMFTDGNSNVGGDANIIATNAKNMGITIYCIGLAATGGIVEENLNKWASTPSSSYVSLAPTPADLEGAFSDLAANISVPGATKIEVTEKINPCFDIEKVFPPTKGGAIIDSRKQIRWTIPQLGVTGSEGASVTFKVRHVGPCEGLVNVNESITYSDNEKNVVTFPSPKILVNCGEVYPIKPTAPIEVTVDSCKDYALAAGEVTLDALGRIISVDAKIKNVCPNRRVALAVVLNEVNALGKEEKRGMKTILVPAHTKSFCTDVTVKCINFVVPEELDTTGATDSICNSRNFNVHMFANYVDYDFEPCDVI